MVDDENYGSETDFEELFYEFLYWVACLDYLKQHKELEGSECYYRDYSMIERITKVLARKINTFEIYN